MGSLNLRHRQGTLRESDRVDLQVCPAMFSFKTVLALGFVMVGIAACPLAASAQGVGRAAFTSQAPGTYYGSGPSAGSNAIMGPGVNSYAPARTSASFSGSTTVDNPVTVTSNIDSANNINVQTNIDATRNINSTTSIQVTNSVNGVSVDYGLSGSNVFNVVDSADGFAASQDADAKASAELGVAEALAAAQLNSN